MAAFKKIRTLAGTKRTAAKAIQEPLNPADLATAVEQLQATVDEVITRFNAHTHSANATAIVVGQQVQGVVVTPTNLFTP